MTEKPKIGGLPSTWKSYAQDCDEQAEFFRNQASIYERMADEAWEVWRKLRTAQFAPVPA